MPDPLAAHLPASAAVRGCAAADRSDPPAAGPAGERAEAASGSPAATSGDGATIEWERVSVFEHQARVAGRLAGLVTRPAPGAFWAHPISYCARTRNMVPYGDPTRHRTLREARQAIEQQTPRGDPADERAA